MDAALGKNLPWNGIHHQVKFYLEDALRCLKNCHLLAELGKGPVGKALFVKKIHEEKIKNPGTTLSVRYIFSNLPDKGCAGEELIKWGDENGKDMTSDHLRTCVMEEVIPSGRYIQCGQ